VVKQANTKLRMHLLSKSDVISRFFKVVPVWAVPPGDSGISGSTGLDNKMNIGIFHKTQKFSN
jgi:hypothetical protein